MNIVSRYIDLMDGIRSFYAAREGDDSSAAYTAVLLLSLLFILNIASLAILYDVFMHENFRLISWMSDHRVVLIPVPIAVIAWHHLVAKKEGIYERRGSARAPWKRTTAIYIVCTAADLALALATGILKSG